MDKDSVTGLTRTYGKVAPKELDISQLESRQDEDRNYDAGSLSPLLDRVFDHKPVYAVVGDSINALGNRHFVSVSLTSYGLVGNVRIIAHDLNVGHHVTIWGAKQAAWNGFHEITRVVSVNEFEIALPSHPEVTTATGSILVYSQEALREVSIFGVGNAASNNKALFNGNYAKGGSRTSDLDAQLDLALNADKTLWNKLPEIVFIISGINDVLNDVSFDDITDNLLSVVNRLLAADVVPVISTLLPIGAGHGSYTIARVNTARKVNTWIKEELPKLGVVVIDGNAVCLDLDDPVGDWKTGYDIDDLHPTKKAVLQLGLEIKDKVWDKISVKEERTLTSVATNPTLSGTGGTVTGTGASGVTADNTTLSITGGGGQLAVGSKGISLTGNGESIRLAVSGTSSSDQMNLIFADAFPSTELKVGDKVIVQIRTRSDLSPTLTGLRMSQLRVAVTIDGVTNDLQAVASYHDTTAASNFDAAWDLLLETPPIKIVSGMTSLIPTYVLRFNSAGGPINVDLSDFNIYKVT